MWRLEADSPNLLKCWLGKATHLKFQPWKTETGYIRTSWLARLAISTSAVFDGDPASVNKIEDDESPCQTSTCLCIRIHRCTHTFANTPAHTGMPHLHTHEDKKHIHKTTALVIHNTIIKRDRNGMKRTHRNQYMHLQLTSLWQRRQNTHIAKGTASSGSDSGKSESTRAN